jgi:hypothetical protein
MPIQANGIIVSSSLSFFRSYYILSYLFFGLFFANAATAVGDCHLPVTASKHDLLAASWDSLFRTMALDFSLSAVPLPLLQSDSLPEATDIRVVSPTEPILVIATDKKEPVAS